MPLKKLTVPPELQEKIERLKAENKHRGALVLRAFWNSEQRFGPSVMQRSTRAKQLRTRRAMDIEPSTYRIKNLGTRGWGLSFAAGLEELKDYYAPFRVEKIVDKLARQQPNQPIRVLEIGTGLGRAAVGLQEKFGNRIEMHATGLSYLPEWKQYQNGSKVRWYVVDADTLAKKFSPESLDFIHSNLGFCYAEYLEHAFEEIHKILKPNGLFLFTAQTEKEIPPGFESIGKVRQPRPKKGFPYPIIVYLLKKTGNFKSE